MRQLSDRASAFTASKPDRGTNGSISDLASGRHFRSPAPCSKAPGLASGPRPQAIGLRVAEEFLRQTEERGHVLVSMADHHKWLIANVRMPDRCGTWRR